MSLTGAVAHIAAEMGKLSGIRKSHEYPPNSIPTELQVITWAESGGAEYGTAGLEARGLHTIVSMITTPANDLARAYAALTPLIESGYAAIMADPTLGGNADTLGRVDYAMGTISFAGKEYCMLRFTVSGVKIRKALT
jgi:hypothetical protein